ncbi:MAG: DNA polymerase IV [Lachnospiraceae bacterium]|nr:DNA polymerase IV [Lachnospiraceae bacterium]
MNDPIIFHIDVNSAFLSWTALDKLKEGSSVDLREIPSIIGGDSATRHGIVLAKSIPAKAFGIQTGEPVANALRKCPHLTLASPDHAHYKEYSHALMEHLSRICPDIEQVSIDECYMDYSPISSRYSSPVKAADFIRESVFQTFQFTVNVGISDRKVLAKMASDFRKPNLTHTLFASEIPEKLWPLPVSNLFLCGHSSVETLRKLGILTIGELAHTDRAILESHLKSHGLLLWNYANGIDASVVETKRAKAKGVGNSTTLSQDVTTAEQAHRILRQLSESVGARMRKAHSVGASVCTEIKYSDFVSVSHQTLLSVPTASDAIIAESACTLFDELWNGAPVRLLGVRVTKLTEDNTPVQLSIFDYQAPRSEKQQKLDAALDSIRARYGKDAIKRGSQMDSHLKSDT